jgi:hypothetical protein
LLHWSRAVRRVLVVGAVAALGTMFIAPAALSASTDNGSGTLDESGVDVPGWEAAKVSGEATGCHSEIEADLNLSLLRSGSDSTSATATTQDAFNQVLDKLNIPDNAPGYLPKLFSQAQDQVASAEAKAAESDPNEIFHEEAGPVPTVKLPWQGGGPVSEKEDDCTLDLFGFIPITLATDLSVQTQGAIGAAGYSHTESQSSDNFGLLYEANQVDTECLATLADIEAKTDVSDGRFVDVNTGAIKDIPEHPKKNDELTGIEFDIPGSGGANLHFEYSLNANEQDDNEKSVTVTGLHSELVLEITVAGQTFFKLSVDGIRDQSHCDIDPQAVTAAAPITVEPKFTG